jgi:TonB family protein
MKKTLLLSLLISMMCAPAPLRSKTAAQSQSSQSAVEHFAKDGLSFDYPTGWKLTDRSTEAAQHLILSREGSSALLMVIAHRDAVANGQQVVAARESITLPYVEQLARSLGVEKVPEWDNNSPCLDVGGRFATGFKLAGHSNGLPSTGEVYALVLGGCFVNLVYVRNDKDDAAGADAWKGLSETLKIDAPPGTTEYQKNIVSGGVLNGKAIKKPQPRYPAGAKAAGQQGVVTVLITVDEEGNVVSAKAVSGAPLLRAAGEEAARGAKFTPTTVCGHPVKVSGVVTYNFVLQFGVTTVRP